MESTLYILYTKDMEKNEKENGIKLKFSDDTAVTEKRKKLGDTIKGLQSEIKVVEQWFDINGIVINEKKVY